MLKPGWLNRQLDKVAKDFKSWPEWLQRETGLEETSESESKKLDLKDKGERKKVNS